MIRYLRPAAALAIVSLAGACGSKNTAQPAAGGGAAPIVNGQCAQKSLTILFSPMYSAFAPNHTFSVPAVVNGLDPSATITFSASDPSMVDIQQPDDMGVAMITTRKAGTVNIIASAGGLCGSSTLTITQATEADWTVGSTRYNNMMAITGGLPRGNRDAGPQDYACTNCHGDTATASTAPFKTVSHTPQQTGGFSDDDLINIFEHGMVPKGGYFDDSIINQNAWSNFHRWAVTDEEAKGLVVYLRSLAPAAQAGMRGDFGGMRVRPDGGFGRGGGGRGDGGMGGGNGGGGTAPVDAGTATD
jgi:hypothetical protein